VNGGRSALLLGSTGLVGGHVLERLLATPAYGRVVAPARRPLGRADTKLEAPVLDLGRMEERPELFGVDDVFCCLGTTIRAAGSQEAFRRVDLEYPAAAARLAARGGARRFLIVTAMGASPRSRIFYNRVKGEVEAAVRAQPLESVVILRPSLLLGERGERRAGEEAGKVAMKVLGFALVGPLRRYRAVEADAVAAAMVRLAREAGPGVRVVESDEIAALAASA
jgi:uncharacterized protein YbjT (DUF2867 family)